MLLEIGRSFPLRKREEEPPDRRLLEMMFFLWDGKIAGPREKPFGAREGTNNNSYTASPSRHKPRPVWRVERALTIKLYRGAFLCLKTVDLRQSNSDITDASGSTAVRGRNVFLTSTLLQQILSRTVCSLYGVTWIFTSCIASHQMRNGACLLVQRWPEVVWEDYKVFAYTFGFLSSNLLT